MKAFLQKGSFVFLFLSLPGAGLLAAPPAGHPPATLQNIWVENFSLPDGTTADTDASSAWTSGVTYSHAVFGVYDNEFKVNNISVNGVGTWTSDPIPIAGKTNVHLSANVRSAGGLENDATVHSDYLRFYYKIDGGAEVLFSNMNGIINNNCTADSTIYSTGTISGSTLQIIVRAKATATDEFYYFDDITVSGETACTADAFALANGTLTCARDSVQLLAGTTVQGAAYGWSGPDGFASAAQNPYIRAAGTYTLLVTAPAGCTATAAIVVAQNINAPAGVTASSTDQLTCVKTQIDLRATSTTPGVSFEWTGPNHFSASTAIAATTQGGNYTLKVTNADNGCVTIVPTMVLQNIIPPAGVSATNSGPLTCDISEVTLTGNSSSPNVVYQWDGPDGYLSFSAQDIAGEAGDYVLTVTNDDNGCIATQTTTVAYNCGLRKAIGTNPAIAESNATGSAFEWKAYPNPFVAKAFIEFTSPTADFVSVQVYGSNGIAEKTLFTQKVTAHQVYRLSLTGLPAGMHYIVIRLNNKVYTRKLLSLQ